MGALGRLAAGRLRGREPLSLTRRHGRAVPCAGRPRRAAATKITPNFASAPSWLPTPGPPARNVVSCLAKSRVRMTRMPDGEHRRRVVLALGHVALQHAREQRRRVLPDVEARVVLDQLEAGHRQRVADAVAEPEPVEHVLDARLDVDEQVEPALLDRQPAAERVAVHPADGRRGPQRVVAEALDVLDLDRQVEHERGRGLAVRLGAAGEVGLAERDVAEHLLGEANGRGHVAAASAARRSGSMIWSAKRSASAAIVKLGFGPGRARHHRAVGDVQAGVAEHVAVRVDDALARVAAHRRAAERVHGDHALAGTTAGCPRSGRRARRRRPATCCARGRSTRPSRDALRQSTSSRPLRRYMRPSGTSRPMPSSGRPPADSSAGSIRSAILAGDVGVRRALRASS